MKLGQNEMKIYMVMQDYDTKKLIKFIGDNYILTDDLMKATILANKKIARDYREKFPLGNFHIVFAKIRFSKKQQWY